MLTAQFQPVYTTGRRDISTLTPARETHLRATGADYVPALRGGQTSYHGPGQLTAYAILDLRRHGLSPRSYIHYLEDVVIRTCAIFGVHGYRTANPGVWVSEEEKVCAVGVHLRRNVSSHGVGLNVGKEPLEWLERVVACGLEGKRGACLDREGGVGVEEVAGLFVREFARGLEGVDEVAQVEVPD